MRELTRDETGHVAGGNDKEAPNMVVTPEATNDGGGSFYGGGSLALGLGAGASGGGGQAFGNASVGLGGSIEVGYSADSERAANEADNSSAIIGGFGNGSAPISITFDTDPFTIGITMQTGVVIPVAETTNK